MINLKQAAVTKTSTSNTKKSSTLFYLLAICFVQAGIFTLYKGPLQHFIWTSDILSKASRETNFTGGDNDSVSIKNEQEHIIASANVIQWTPRERNVTGSENISVSNRNENENKHISASPLVTQGTPGKRNITGSDNDFISNRHENENKHTNVSSLVTQRKPGERNITGDENISVSNRNENKNKHTSDPPLVIRGKSYEYRSDYRFEHIQRSTTCKGRQGIENRTLLHIDTSKEGSFPETQFTDYINKTIISNFNTNPRSDFCNAFTFSINEGKSNAQIEIADIGNKGFSRTLGHYMKLFDNYVFSEDCERNVPRSPSVLGETEQTLVGFVLGDVAKEVDHNFQCLALGSTAGTPFSTFNFLTVRDFVGNYHTAKLDNRFAHLAEVPWEKRDPIPVWRGTLWGWKDYGERFFMQEKRGRLTLPEIIDHWFTPDPNTHHQRVPLTGFSLKRPDLLNARGKMENMVSKHYPTAQFLAAVEKLTNTTKFTIDDIFLPFDQIPQSDYYSKFQVVVVMGGIGAAFRTADHLAMGSAVIMQDYPYKEWFFPYMTPYVDYIPLEMHLGNLEETLRWVKDNPQHVKRIARNGRLFYERYLSYEKIEEFYYELFYRLVEARIDRGIQYTIEAERENPVKKVTKKSKRGRI